MGVAMNRFCKRCEIETDRNGSGKCRPCVSRRNSEWKKKNPERVKANEARFRANNPTAVRESRRESTAKWRALNPDKSREVTARAETIAKEARRIAREARRKQREAYLAANADKIREEKNRRCRLWHKANPDKVRELNRRWRGANKEKLKLFARHRTWRKNGWTPERFDIVWRLQGGKCAICPRELTTGWREENSVFADHDHATGSPRGLLCRNCNTAIGLLKDNPSRAREVALYLESDHAL
jgi:hypothetical protein